MMKLECPKNLEIVCGELANYMATGKHQIARPKITIPCPEGVVEYNPGDGVPPIIELDRAAEVLAAVEEHPT